MQIEEIHVIDKKYLKPSKNSIFRELFNGGVKNSFEVWQLGQKIEMFQTFGQKNMLKKI